MPRLFLSHSSDNQAEIIALRQALELRSVACYQDMRERRAGDRLLELVRILGTTSCEPRRRPVCDGAALRLSGTANSESCRCAGGPAQVA